VRSRRVLMGPPGISGGGPEDTALGIRCETGVYETRPLHWKDPIVDETKFIHVRYWAAAKAAAGTETDALDVTGPSTLADVRRRAADLHPGTRLAEVLSVCSVLVGDRPAGTRPPEDVVVEPGESVEFLPPFAGG
jgi:molybdopterin converting factor small subunit